MEMHSIQCRRCVETVTATIPYDRALQFHGTKIHNRWILCDTERSDIALCRNSSCGLGKTPGGVVAPRPGGDGGTAPCEPGGVLPCVMLVGYAMRNDSLDLRFMISRSIDLVVSKNVGSD